MPCVQYLAKSLHILLSIKFPLYANRLQVELLAKKTKNGAFLKTCVRPYFIIILIVETSISYFFWPVHDPPVTGIESPPVLSPVENEIHLSNILFHQILSHSEQNILFHQIVSGSGKMFHFNKYCHAQAQWRHLFHLDYCQQHIVLLMVIRALPCIFIGVWIFNKQKITCFLRLKQTSLDISEWKISIGD